MQILLNGLIQGLLIALTAVGFSAVYNSTGIFHIGQAAVYALTPFFAQSLIQAGVTALLAVIISITGAVIFSILLEVVNHWPLHKKEASPQIHLITSLGIYLASVQFIAILWGNETRILREGIDSTFTFREIILTRSQLFGGLASILCIAGFFIWLKKTNAGLKFKALSDNPIQLSLMGYNIKALRMLAFGLSGIFTAAASLLTATDIGFDPHGGLAAVLLGIVATITGGRGTFVGPVVSGILLGLIRAEVVWHTSSRVQDALTFLILVLFLFFRPQGIMGKKGRVETL